MKQIEKEVFEYPVDDDDNYGDIDYANLASKSFPEETHFEIIFFLRGIVYVVCRMMVAGLEMIQQDCVMCIMYGKNIILPRHLNPLNVKRNKKRFSKFIFI